MGEPYVNDEEGRVKNVTITLPEDLDRWLRDRAAENERSVSNWVAELLDGMRRQEDRYEAAMQQALSIQPEKLNEGGKPYPSRDALYDRPIPDPLTDMPGEMALPRRNGELVFATPWEARAFGLAVALQESGVYEWRDFSAALAAEIARAEQAGNASAYYECWLASLEKLLSVNGLVTPAELSDRMALHAARDDHAGHDDEP